MDPATRPGSTPDLESGEILFDTSPIGMATNGPDGRFVTVNRAFCEMLGYSREQLLEMTFRDVSHPEDLDECNALVDRLLRGERSQESSEKRFLHRDGRVVSATVTVVLNRDPDGRPQSFLAQVLNVTDRLDAEAAHLESEERYRRVFDSSTDGLLVLNREGRIVTVNPAGCRMQGCERDDLVGCLPMEFAHPDSHELFAQLQRAVTSGEECHLEGRSVTKDGAERFVEVQGVPFRIDGEDHVLVMLRDITERKEAEAKLAEYLRQLESANRDLEKFVSIAAHDLKEPLRKIEAFGDRLALRCEPELGEEGAGYLSRIRDAGRWAGVLIRDLLTYSRLVTRLEPFRRVDLGACVREVVSDLAPEIEESGARIEIGSLPEVEGDPGQIRRAFGHLLENALKFRSPERPLRVQVTADPPSPDGKTERIRVTDNGVGFDPEYVEKIFGVFQTLHGRQEYGGTGMGLAVCRKIVTRHGGTLSADSRPGEGSTFVVELPREAALGGQSSG